VINFSKLTIRFGDQRSVTFDVRCLGKTLIYLLTYLLTFKEE